MKGLQKVNNDLYVSEDGYTLKKGYAHFGKRMNKVRRLYSPNGVYMGQPSTVAEANKWIKYNRVHKEI